MFDLSKKSVVHKHMFRGEAKRLPVGSSTARAAPRVKWKVVLTNAGAAGSTYGVRPATFAKP
jgi:hypothetical protein